MKYKSFSITNLASSHVMYVEDAADRTLLHDTIMTAAKRYLERDWDFPAFYKQTRAHRAETRASLSGIERGDTRGHYYGNVISACADYVMAMRGKRWDYQIAYNINGSVALILQQPACRPEIDCPVHIQDVSQLEAYIIRWARGQATAIEIRDVALVDRIWNHVRRSNQIEIVGIPQDPFDVQMVIDANRPRTVPLAAVKIPMQKVARECPYCAGTVGALQGIDTGIVAAILGCEKCGA